MQNCDEPCVGPKHRMARLEMETTWAVLGQRRRYQQAICCRACTHHTSCFVHSFLLLRSIVFGGSRMKCLATAILLLAGFAGCAGTRQHFRDVSTLPRDEAARPDTNAQLLSRTKTWTKNVASATASIALSPFQPFIILHAYNQAEREGGTLP